MNKWKRNIKLLYGIRACYSLIFSISVLTLFWKKYGLDLIDMFWLHAIFAISIAILEIPTGYLGDWLGRKKTLILSTVIASICWFLYAMSNSFEHFIIVEILLGIAYSLLSGTDTAMLYESLKELDKTDNFTKISGKQHSIMHWAEGLSAVIGGFLITLVSIEILFVFTGIALFVGFILSFMLEEPHRESYKHPKGTLFGLYKIARFVFLRSKMVRFVLPLMAFCSLSTMLGVWLYQPLWQEKQIPIWLFGVLWALLSVPAGFASHFAHSLEQKVGNKKILWLLPVPVILGYFLTALVPGMFGIVFIYFIPFLRGFSFPVLTKYINEETFSDKRATVLSIQSWLFRFMYFIIGPFIGWIGKSFSLQWAFVICGIWSFVTIMIFIPILIRRLPDRAL